MFNNKKGRKLVKKYEDAVSDLLASDRKMREIESEMNPLQADAAQDRSQEIIALLSEINRAHQALDSAWQEYEDFDTSQ